MRSLHHIFWSKKIPQEKYCTKQNKGKHLQYFIFLPSIASVLLNHLLKDVIHLIFIRILSHHRSQGAFIQRCCVSRGALYSVPWPCSAGNFPPTFSIAWWQHGRISIYLNHPKSKYCNEFSMKPCFYNSFAVNKLHTHTHIFFGTLQGGDWNALI